MYRREFKKNSTSDFSQTLRNEIGRDENHYKRRAILGDINNSQCRVVRIFISSTFKDFFWERDVLVKIVFPKLRSWCEERNIFLLECDLRWGVPKEATGQEAILTCLEEIEKSREEMRGCNFFLGLIGQRYGWSPEIEEVGDHIAKRYSWIRGASVTLMEIVFGALRTMSPNALFMLREPDFISELDDATRRIYCESDSEVVDKMNHLRTVLSNIFDNRKQINHYTCKYEGVVRDPFSGKEKVKIGGLEDFGETVYQFFLKAIENQITNNQDDSEAVLENNENDQHKLLFRALIRNAHGRSDVLNRLLSLICDNQLKSPVDKSESDLVSFKDGNKIICLFGPTGIGKSTLMACLIKDLTIKNNTNVFYHFCGASVSSKSEDVIKSRIVEFLKIGKENPKNELHNLLADVNIPTIILIDALDEICNQGNTILNWLPYNSPKNVYFIVSCLDKTGTIFNKLDERCVEKFEVSPLDDENCVQIAQSFFMDYGKKLDDKQMQLLLSNKSSSNPLWLIQACEELRIHGDYSSLTEAISILPDDINHLNIRILSRILVDDTTSLLKPFLQVLFVSRVGVWETDVRKILAVIGNQEESEISQAVWNQVIRSLKPFVNRESNPVPVIKFRHRIIKEVIFKELFESKEEVEELNSSLANIYSDIGNSNYKGTELAYHLYCSYRWHDLSSYLRTKESWQYIRRQFTRSQVMKSLRCMQSTNANQKENLLKLCDFCKNTFGLLSCYTPNTNACLFCGGPHFNFCEARLCPRHEMENFRFKENCISCKRPCAFGKFVPVNICMMCANIKNRCAKIIDEKDHSFHGAKNMAIKPENIAW